MPIFTPILTPSGTPLFALKKGQVAIAVAMMAIIIAIIVGSFAAYQSAGRTQAALLAEESDAAAVVFTQRESFGLVLEFDKYAQGNATLADVVIARSTLAKRLNVITSNGRSTFEIAGADYRDALARLDLAISEEITPQEFSTRTDILEAKSAFLTQTRMLSAQFKTISEENIKSTVQERAVRDLVRAGLSVLALSLGSVLFVWLVRDITAGLRRGFEELESRELALREARDDFRELELTEKRIGQWVKRLEEGGDASAIALEVDQALAIIRSSRPHDRPRTGSPNDHDVESLLADRLGALRASLAAHSSIEVELQWERNHCPLCGLLNRRGLGLEFSAMMKDQTSRPLLLATLDIADFTSINSSMGQAAGDSVLTTMARRLEKAVPAGGAVGRTAADEFGLAIPLGGLEPEALMQRIADAATFALTIDDEEAQVTSDIGWYVVTDDGESPASASAKCAAALTLAREAPSRGTIHQFDPDSDSALLTEFKEQIELRAALLNGEILPYYQPIVTMGDRRVRGFEALARWESPSNGLTQPNSFISLAARAGLLDELFDVILNDVASSWLRTFSVGVAPENQPYVSINVDPNSLAAKDFALRVLRTLSGARMPPEKLVLEITEASLVDPQTVAQLTELRASGVRIAVDDFGTGYSSLSQLRDVPIDIIKVDRSFLSHDDESEEKPSMLRTILQMGDSAGLVLIVEGIETPEWERSLQELGYTLGQGFLYGKAVPVAEAKNLFFSDKPKDSQ
jgi:diguanylate cyclase (GGDEF)-like protein